jgi:hypothetical protein
MSLGQPRRDNLQRRLIGPPWVSPRLQDIEPDEQARLLPPLGRAPGPVYRLKPHPLLPQGGKSLACSTGSMSCSRGLTQGGPISRLCRLSRRGCPRLILHRKCRRDGGGIPGSADFRESLAWSDNVIIV